jgi:hypothetical protein
MLPVRVAAKGKHEGQRLAVGEKIRLLAHRAEQVQGYYSAGSDEARQQPLRVLDGRRSGSGLRAAHTGFDEGRRRSRQLRAPGQIQAQRMTAKPALRMIEGEDGALVLAPMRRPCCLELLCYQGSSFSRAVMATSLCLKQIGRPDRREGCGFSDDRCNGQLL